MLEKHDYESFLTWVTGEGFNLGELKKKIALFEAQIISFRDKVISDEAGQKKPISLNYLSDYNLQYDLNKFKQHFKVIDSEFEGLLGSRPNSLITKFFDQRSNRQGKNLLEALVEKNDIAINNFIVNNMHLFEIYSHNAKGDAYICAVKSKNNDLFAKLIEDKVPYKNIHSGQNIIKYIIEENDLKRFKMLFPVFEAKLLEGLQSNSNNFFIDILKNNSYHIFNFLMVERRDLVEENLKRVWKPLNKNGKEFAPDKSSYVDLLSIHDNQSIFETILNNTKFEMIFDNSKSKDSFSIVYQYLKFKFNQFSKKQIDLPRANIEKMIALFDTKDLYTRTRLVQHILRTLPLPWNYEKKTLLESEKEFNSMVLQEVLNGLNRGAQNETQKFLQQILIGKNGNMFLLSQVFLDTKYMKNYSDFFLNDDLVLEIDSQKIEKINSILKAQSRQEFFTNTKQIDVYFSNSGEVREFFEHNISFINGHIYWAQNEPYSHENNQWLHFFNTNSAIVQMLSNEGVINNRDNGKKGQENKETYTQMMALMEKKKLERLTLDLMDRADKLTGSKTFKL